MALDPTEEAALRAALQAAVDYRDNDHARPVRPADSAPAAFERFREAMPDQGTPADEVIVQLIDRIEPGLMTTTSPRFHGWVASISS